MILIISEYNSNPVILIIVVDNKSLLLRCPETKFPDSLEASTTLEPLNVPELRNQEMRSIVYSKANMASLLERTNTQRKYNSDHNIMFAISFLLYSYVDL